MKASGVSLSRRDFLSTLRQGLLWMSGLLAFGGLLRFLSYRPDPMPPNEFDLGLAADYPPGTRTVIPEAQAILLHTAAGFTALSLVCPHLGCQVEKGVKGFVCPCHGSEFDADGSRLRGPAQKPMSTLPVRLTPDGHLILSRY